jgi:hypothetical protein
MSDFKFKCICCNAEIDVTSAQVGYVVYCPKCMAELIVPEFTGDTPLPIAPDPEKLRERDLHQTDSVVLMNSIRPSGSIEPDESAPTPPPAGMFVPEPHQQDDYGHPSSESISQIIYRDSSGKPMIPNDVSRAVASGNMGEMTETKLALAETLKALQEHQRALAEARKELAANKVVQSDTNMMEISDTTNKLINEDQDATTELNLEPSSFVFQPKDTPIEEEPHPVAEEVHQVEEPKESVHADDMEYHPFYTPRGEFLPFTDEDFSEALQHETDAVLVAISEIRPGPECWSYSVFALLLENHVGSYLPERLPITPMSGVFFGSGQKYLDEIRTQHTIFMNVLRRMIKPMGVQFQFALKHHDIYAFAEILNELDTHLHEFHQFMMNFQQIAFPKKEPFIRFRERMLECYDYVRFRLVRVVERLDHRSAFTPEQAMLGTINVSLNPPQLHEMALLLKLFPVQ